MEKGNKRLAIPILPLKLDPNKTQRKKFILSLPLYFCLFFIFPFFSDRNFSNKFLFSCVKVLNDMAGINQGTNSNKLEYHFLPNTQI